MSEDPYSWGMPADWWDELDDDEFWGFGGDEDDDEDDEDSAED